MDWLTFFLRGIIRVRVQGASPESLPNRLARARIAFWNLRRIDDFTIELTIFRADLPHLRQAVSRCMCTMQVLQVRGFAAAFGGLRHRLVLLVGLLCSVIFVLTIQNFVWYYDITGNETVSDLQIIAALEASGVGAGTCIFSVDPQLVENRMLSILPELEQVGLNFYGGCAEILIRERSPKPELDDRRTACNLVASRSGLILEMDVFYGDEVVKPGDIVLPGQLLVSGLGDRTLGVQQMHASAEIYAQTWRDKTAVTLDSQQKKVYTGETTRRYALTLGKKRIKLSLGSGISMDNCDKMTVIKPLTLPGGIVLPIYWETDTYRAYEPEQVPQDGAALETQLYNALAHEIQQDGVAVEILEAEGEKTDANGLCAYRAVFTCREMIARESEIYKSGDEKDDRTDN